MRVLVFDRADSFLFEIDPALVTSALMTEEVGGSHCLDIATVQPLRQSQRLLVQDGTGAWREFVVVGVDESHEAGACAVGAYHAVWSVQHDLMTVYDVERLGEITEPVPARTCLEAALAGTARWAVGEVTATGTAMPEMFGNSCWERVCDVANLCAGEVEADVEVGVNKVVARRVNLLSAVGSQRVTRRFDWGNDVTSIRRKPPEEPLCCRVIFKGKGDDVDIEALNGGVSWLQDDDAAAAYRMPDGKGGWEYPTKVVQNNDIDDDRVLLAWARAHLTDYTRPVPTYEASVAQYAKAGMDVHGVALGDVVHVVDRGFSPDAPLRLEGRVVKVVSDLAREGDASLTIGDLGGSLARTFRDMDASVSAVKSKLDVMYAGSGRAPTTGEYLSWLIGMLNNKINATGGYAYVKEGEGIWVYDRAEDQNPTKVINLMGGSLRIASSKTAQGEWNWKTIMTAEDGLVASAVTAANITTGFIGSPSGNYWNLDTGELRMLASTPVGNTTMQGIIDKANSTITRVDVEYAQGQSATTAPTSGWATTAPAWREGWYIWSRTATTTAAGTAYSAPVMISGRDGADGQDGADGADGRSVTILGSYDTLADLEAAHPTGSAGDGYLVAGDLYVWDGSRWDNVGTIQGPQGPQGPKGDRGDDGEHATVYSLTPSIDAVVRDADGAIRPTAVMFSATSTTGSGEAASYAGRIRVQTSTDGATWTNRYTSASDESSCTYTPAASVAASMRYVRATLYRAGGTAVQLDRQSVPVVSDGAQGGDGAAGAAGADAYTVLLSNEAHTFAGDADSAIASSVAVQVIAYKGTARMPATVGTVTGRPTGMSVAVTGNGTAEAALQVSVTEDMTARNGVLSVPVTVDGEEFPLAFSYSLALSGRDGGSVTVRSATKEGGTTTVVLASGDGTTTTLSIDDGEDGSRGVPGEPGSDGRSSYVHVAWANSADGRTDFSTSVSAGKKYLGVRSDDVAEDSQDPSAYAWALIQGEAATTYSISASVDAVARGADGAIRPASVLFSATSKTGSGASAEYAGRIRVQTSTDGTNWTTRYTSAANQSSYTYAPTAAIAKAARYIRGILFAAGGTSVQLDRQTVAILDDGATGAQGEQGEQGAPGADAYTVVLSNESHTFAGTRDAAVADSTTCQVIAYKGAARVAATIGAITGKPAGMTTSVANNGTTSAAFTVSVTSSMKTRAGTLTVPLTIDGKSFTATFSYALALVGETGGTGAAGKGVSAIVEQYYLSTSSSTQTGGSWSAEQPAWSSGKHIWTRSQVTWSDGTTTTTTPVLAKALTGANSTAAAASSAASAASSTASAAKTQIEALDTQQGVFNRLTDNGRLQGIVMENGQLYVNAAYIKSGTVSSDLVLAGAVKVSGEIESKSGKTNNPPSIVRIYNETTGNYQGCLDFTNWNKTAKYFSIRSTSLGADISWLSMLTFKMSAGGSLRVYDSANNEVVFANNTIFRATVRQGINKGSLQVTPTGLNFMKGSKNYVVV